MSHARLEIRLLRNQVQQQRVEATLRAAPRGTRRHCADRPAPTIAMRDVELIERVTAQGHLLELADVPGAHDDPPASSDPADLVEHALHLVDRRPSAVPTLATAQ
jgi:hypothetical protein